MQLNRTVRVELGERSYDIITGWKVLDDAGVYLGPLLSGRKCHLITDSNVAPLYADKLSEILESAGAEVSQSIIPAGETHKNLATIGELLAEIIGAGLDRGSRILALGGGVTGDMAGFTAAIYMRGIKFIQVPTSLLAMVDSSVGGKTGVDLPQGKNLVGAFWQPEKVLIDQKLLLTLPDRELCCGLAEVVKYGIIADAALFADLEKNTDKLLKRDPDFYGEIISRCCRIKAEVVAGDEHENGRRAILNYGHTFGHAIEAVSDFAVGHGEGVAIGMCMAADLAVKLDMFSSSEADRQEQLLRRLGLPTRCDAGLSPDNVTAAMARDKKKRDGKLVFILPRRIGEVVAVDGLDPELILETVRGRCD